jgi:hypothetical protein
MDDLVILLQGISRGCSLKRIEATLAVLEQR